MGFTDFSSDAGLDRESLQRMGMETLLIDFRVEHLADYAELYCWVSFSILKCYRFMHSFYHTHYDERHIGPCL